MNEDHHHPGGVGGGVGAGGVQQPSVSNRYRYPHHVPIGWRCCFQRLCNIRTTTNTNNTQSSSSHDQQSHIPEVQIVFYGLILDVYGRATLGMSSLFLGPALLQCAAIAAGCVDDTMSNNNNNDVNNNNDDDNNVYEECSNTIYGFRPSSLLTMIATIAGIGGTILLPYIGSIVDYTSYRQLLGKYTAFTLIIIKAMEISISQATWQLIAFLQIVSSIVFYSHITTTYAYISELSTNPSQQSSYNTTLFIIMYTSTLLFMILVLLTSNVVFHNDNDDNDIVTARISQCITVLTCLPTFTYAWIYLFPHRPPSASAASSSWYLQQHGRDEAVVSSLSSIQPPPRNNGDVTKDHPPPHSLQLHPQPPSCRTLLVLGYQQVYTTLCKLWRLYPSTISLLCAVAYSEAASTALITISTTYLKHVLQMSASEIGIVFFVVLLSGFPGSQWGSWCTTTLLRGNPVHSLLWCNLYFIASTSLATYILRGPNDKHWAIMFGGLWGSALGWLQPQHTAAYVPIIPRGQEAELMGLYLFAGQCLSWLPPTVFTVMNELHIPMSYGLGSLSIFFMAGAYCLCRMGPYDDAIRVAANSSPTVHGGDDDDDCNCGGGGQQELVVPPTSSSSCRYTMVHSPRSRGEDHGPEQSRYLIHNTSSHELT